MQSVELLDRLIALPTVSRDSNLELMKFVGDFLSSHGITSRLVEDRTGRKANLFASVGPQDRPGIMLSGHSDTVPVDGQDWSSDPFRLTRRHGRLYGRGTADMKGFLACALRAAAEAAKRQLRTPLWLAFSHDEEIGCIGVRRLIEVMRDGDLRPQLCIIGEPTSMKIATGHKGKTALRAECRGRAAHTAFAPETINALHLGSDFVQCLRDAQARIAARGPFDSQFRIPYTTIHAARMEGGIAPNIVPALAEVDFEIRNIASDDPAGIVRDLEACAAELAAGARELATEAGISISIVNSYPGLETHPDSPAIAFMRSLTGENDTIKVAFGTEGGLFADWLDIPVAICGPGSMEQGHKPDEYIELSEIERCDAMLDRLVARLEAGC